MRIEDELLLANARSGNRDAVVRLATRWWTRVFRFALNMLASASQAAAVTEETMFVLLDAGATPAPARILVYRTALQFSLLRRRWKPQTTESGCAMRKAIQRLSDIDRAALLLRDVEGLTVDEVAAVLRNSQREVRERAHRGRLLLIEATADDALPRAG